MKVERKVLKSKHRMTTKGGEYVYTLRKVPGRESCDDRTITVDLDQEQAAYELGYGLEATGVTTSDVLARVFKVKHHQLMEHIASMPVSMKFENDNWSLVWLEEVRRYERMITKRGVIMIVMSLDCDEAFGLKERFIECMDVASVSFVPKDRVTVHPQSQANEESVSCPE